MRTQLTISIALLALVTLIATIALLPAAIAHAEAPTVNFSVKDGEITKVVEEYAKISGQKFIIDPQIKGKITIINKDPVTMEEAFNQMSSALAVNGVGISKQGSEMIVMQSRSTQRDLIEVTTELPAMNPTRMVTWVISLKFVSADEVNKQLRILTSKDGELVPFTPRNQLIVTDWTPNLHRIQKILALLDVPASSSMPKFSPASSPAKGDDSVKSEKKSPHFSPTK